MTDREGELVQQYGYSPYGRQHYRGDNVAFNVSNRYTGQIFDEDIGLYYYGAHYYDPELARFIQPDSVIPGEITADSQVLNRYSYVINNPLKYIDPSGNYFTQIPFILYGIGTNWGIGGAIGGGFAGFFYTGRGFLGAIQGAYVGYGTTFARGFSLGLTSNISTGVASAVGQISSAAASGLWNAGSFTINAVQSTISPAGKLVGAITSAVYGTVSETATYPMSLAMPNFLKTDLLGAGVMEPYSSVVDPVDVNIADDVSAIQAGMSLAGERFATLDDAVSASLLELYALTNRDGVEYASWICRDFTNITYSFTDLVKGTRLTVDPGLMPIGAIALAHSHPRIWYAPGAGKGFSPKDIRYSVKYKINVYLATPSGMGMLYQYGLPVGITQSLGQFINGR